jgi:hypothetical protein
MLNCYKDDLAAHEQVTQLDAMLQNIGQRCVPRFYPELSPIIDEYTLQWSVCSIARDQIVAF